MISNADFQRVVSELFPNAKFGYRYSFTIPMDEQEFEKRKQKIVNALDDAIGFICFSECADGKVNFSLLG